MAETRADVEEIVDEPLPNGTTAENKGEKANGGQEREAVEIEATPETGSRTCECCSENLDNLWGDTVRGCRDCCCCLGRATTEVYRGCRRLECSRIAKSVFTLDSLRRKFPFTYWLPKYRPRHLFGDLLAGITVALMSIPQGLAYSKLCRLPPQYGLYSLFMPCFVYVLFGMAKDLSIGPTSTVSLLTGEYSESPIPGDPTYAIVLAMMTGIITLIMGIFHLGFLANYISYPVIDGYTSASCVIIIINQLPNWLGLQGIPRGFIQQVYWISKKLPETRIYDFALGLVCMIFLFLTKKMKTSPCMKTSRDSVAIKAAKYSVWLLSTARTALVLFGSAGLAAVLSLYGFEPFTLTGYIPPGLPPFKLPAFSVSDGNTTYTAQDIFTRLGTGLLALPLLCIVPTLVIGKTFSRINKYKVESNQELIALGVGNLLGSFVGGFPVSGNFSRSSVNSQSGAMTPASGFWTGCLVLIVVAFLTPFFAYIPDPTLASIIIIACFDIADFTLVIELWDVKKIDIITWLVTFIISLAFGINIGTFAGIIVSLCILLYPNARPTVKEVNYDSAAAADDDETNCAKENLKAKHMILEVNHGLTFPSTEYFTEKVLKKLVSGEKGVRRFAVLDFVHVSTLDSTVVRGIQQLSRDLASAEVKLVFCNVQPQVLKILPKIHSKNLLHFPTRMDALAAIYAEADSSSSDVTSDVMTDVKVVPVNGETSKGNGTTLRRSSSASSATNEEESSRRSGSSRSSETTTPGIKLHKTNRDFETYRL